MRYEFHPEALAEYEEAGHYYAEQQAGLDLRFVEHVEEAVQLILDDPNRWRPFDEDVRRCLTRVFPYGILYTLGNSWSWSAPWCSNRGPATRSSSPPV